MMNETKEIIAKMNELGISLMHDYEQVFEIAKSYTDGMDELEASWFVGDVLNEINEYEMENE